MIGPAFMIVTVLLPAALGGGCIPVTGGRIMGRDLKAARNGFDTLPDDVLVGLSPLPGIRRLVSARELERVARPFGIEIRDRSEVCFVREGRALLREEIQAAMRRALGRRPVSIEIVDSSRLVLPDGQLEFSLSGLSRPPTAHPEFPVTWRGRVRFADNSSASVWASVRLVESRTWIEAATAISPHQTARAEQVRSRNGSQFPLVAPALTDGTEVVGRLARHSIAAGQPLYAAMFEAPPVVAKDQDVRVEVASGAITLGFDARAETAGQRGDLIVVRDAQRRWKARVVAKGKVVIDVQDSKKNVDAVVGDPLAGGLRVGGGPKE